MTARPLSSRRRNSITGGLETKSSVISALIDEALLISTLAGAPGYLDLPSLPPPPPQATRPTSSKMPPSNPIIPAHEVRTRCKELEYCHVIPLGFVGDYLEIKQLAMFSYHGAYENNYNAEISR